MQEEATTLLIPRPDSSEDAEVELVPNVVAGRYRIEGVLGRGGMSVVYRVTDLQLQVVRALKVALLSSFGDALLERMAAEAAILTFLRHPNLVAVHDMGTDPDHGLHYAVMDYAPGGSLGDVRELSGPLPVADVADIGVQVCCVLSMLHERGILHRDLKPTNILLDAKGRVLLTDLGISKIPDASGEETTDDQVMGSFPYMAPEQRLGMDAVTIPSDLYAVGTTLYNLTTGASAMDIFALREEHPRWQIVPEPLRAVLRWATRFDPDERPQNARALAERLAPLAHPQLFEDQPHLAAWLGMGTESVSAPR